MFKLVIFNLLTCFKVLASDIISCETFKKGGRNYVTITTYGDKTEFSELFFVSNDDESIPDPIKIKDLTSQFNTKQGNKKNTSYSYEVPNRIPKNKLYYLVGTTNSEKYVQTEPYYLNSKKFIPKSQLTDDDYTVNRKSKNKQKGLDDEDSEEDTGSNFWMILAIVTLGCIGLIILVYFMCMRIQ